MSSVFGPLITVIIVALIIRKSMDKELARLSSIGVIASSLSVTAFPSHYAVLQELNLLSSEVGNMALSIALISDSIEMNFLVVLEAMKQGEVSAEDSLCVCDGLFDRHVRNSHCSRPVLARIGDSKRAAARGNLGGEKRDNYNGNNYAIFICVYRTQHGFFCNDNLAGLPWDRYLPWLFQDKESVPSLVNLLEVSYPTVNNPFSVYAFHLVELIGRANPLFIDHQNQEQEDLSSRFPDSAATIHHALKLYQERRE
ncbi:hypothetical protein CRYUN_Cryun02cG0212800 [Craigia yunnanensis]